MTKTLVIGTRGSKLALWQANYVADRIKDYHPGIQVSIKPVITTGDKILDLPLAKIGGKGLFTAELEKALLAGEIDLAVHSLKDVSAELPAGLALGAVTERLDAGDALISPRYGTLDKLPPGARVGTSSLRRTAQLLHRRPDLTIVSLRGNIETRLAKLRAGELDAIILAVAGLKRLGWEDQITEVLPTDVCIPAMGQGALAVEIRQGDAAVGGILEFLNDHQTARAVAAERAYLQEIEGGCQVPVGVYGRIAGQRLVIDASILSADGKTNLRDSISGDPAEAESLGRTLARRMCAAGGREILAALLAGSKDGEEE